MACHWPHRCLTCQACQACKSSSPHEILQHNQKSANLLGIQQQRHCVRVPYSDFRYVCSRSNHSDFEPARILNLRRGSRVLRLITFKPTAWSMQTIFFENRLYMCQLSQLCILVFVIMRCCSQHVSYMKYSPLDLVKGFCMPVHTKTAPESRLAMLLPMMPSASGISARFRSTVISKRREKLGGALACRGPGASHGCIE